MEDEGLTIKMAIGTENCYIQPTGTSLKFGFKCNFAFQELRGKLKFECQVRQKKRFS